MKRTRLILWLNACALSVWCTAVMAEIAQPASSPEYFGLLRGGDVQKLRKALDTGMPVTARDPQGNTPLMLAAAYSDAASVKLLLFRARRRLARFLREGVR